MREEWMSEVRNKIFVNQVPSWHESLKRINLSILLQNTDIQAFILFFNIKIII